MQGQQTTAEQDAILTRAEASTLIDELLDVVRNLDNRLNQAVDRLNEHDLDTTDLSI